MDLRFDWILRVFAEGLSKIYSEILYVSACLKMLHWCNIGWTKEIGREPSNRSDTCSHRPLIFYSCSICAKTPIFGTRAAAR